MESYLEKSITSVQSSCRHASQSLLQDRLTHEQTWGGTVLPKEGERICSVICSDPVLSWDVSGMQTKNEVSGINQEISVRIVLLTQRAQLIPYVLNSTGWSLQEHTHCASGQPVNRIRSELFKNKFPLGICCRQQTPQHCFAVQISLHRACFVNISIRGIISSSKSVSKGIKWEVKRCILPCMVSS